MAGHGLEQFTCSWVPQLYCVIIRTAGKDVGVGVEGYVLPWFGED